MSFQSLGLNTRILQAIDDAGYSTATPIQKKTIPPILKGKDLIGLAQTGTGKTAAFTLPLLSELCEKTHELATRGTRVLIIAPTRELVMQINDSIRTYGKYTNLRTAMVIGGASEKHQIEKLESNVDIVIATPGRLMALMEAGHAVFGKLTHLILDEADRMLDMGFMPDIEKITASLPKRRQSLLFSATLPPQVERLAKKTLKNPVTIEVGSRSNPAETVTQFLYPVEQHLKADLLIELLEDHQFFFTSSTSTIKVVYSDQDGNGKPIGLSTSLTTTAAGSGILTITLRHEADKSASGVSDGEIANAGGETDIEVSFPTDVQ